MGRLRPQHQEQQQVSRFATQSWTKHVRPRMCMKDYLHRYGKALDRRSKLHRKQAHLQAGGEEGMKARICHLRKVTRTKIQKGNLGYPTSTTDIRLWKTCRWWLRLRGSSTSNFFLLTRC